MDPAKPADRGSSERTPLLNGEGSNNTAGGATRHRRPTSGSNLKHFFTNARWTPGTEHDNLVVRSAAYTWHVTKVTLLSSAFVHSLDNPQDGRD